MVRYNPNMELVIDTPLSMEFWRRCHPLNRSPLPAVAMPSKDFAYLARDVLQLAPPWVTLELLDKIGGRILALTFDKTQKRYSQHHVVHVWGGEIPSGSFYRLSESVLIASPEFVFLAAACALDRHALIALGTELCGRYSFDEREPRGFRTREVPLVTVERLRRYLSDAQHCRGYKRALASLDFIVPNAASPMEAFCAMALSLPPRLGGYGFPKPIMNMEVPLSKRAQIIARRTKCYADICYPNAYLDIEYLGEYDHIDPSKMSLDRARVNGLKEMGFEVIELTNQQTQDIYAFECIVQRAAKLIGKRIRKQYLGDTEARRRLHDGARAWNKSNGRLI